MKKELLDAVDHLLTYGYCVLEDRLPHEQACSMAEKLLQFHDDSSYAEYNTGERPYETLFGLLNYEDRVWDCAFHTDTVSIARDILGQNCRVVEARSKPNWPGYQGQWPLHVDSAGNFKQVPDAPWMINSIWMLTDFTATNGATKIVPMSHRSGLKSPPADLKPDDPIIKNVTGRSGSVMMWHGGMFHGAGPNIGQDIRVGLNVAYYPRWMNNWVEGGHQPLWPETYERMPEEYQALCVGKTGRTREEVYEV